MAYTTTVAAIKSAIDDAIDAQVVSVSGTPLAKELEAVLATTVAALRAAGTISNTVRVEDA